MSSLFDLFIFDKNGKLDRQLLNSIPYYKPYKFNINDKLLIISDIDYEYEWWIMKSITFINNEEDVCEFYNIRKNIYIENIKTCHVSFYFREDNVYGFSLVFYIDAIKPYSVYISNNTITTIYDELKQDITISINNDNNIYLHNLMIQHSIDFIGENTLREENSSWLLEILFGLYHNKIDTLRNKMIEKIRVTKVNIDKLPTHVKHECILSQK